MNLPPIVISLMIAIMLQLAAVDSCLRYFYWAACLVVVAIAMIVWRTRQAGGGISRKAQEWMRDAFANLIIISGIIRCIFFLIPWGGGGHNVNANSLPKSQSTAAGDGASDQSGIHFGVILLPEMEQHVLLVPPLPSMRSNLFKSKDDHPLNIPFYGAYWFFKPPDRKPPSNSFVTRGSPIDTWFSTPDHRLLQMEAHQNLGKLIDLACCKEIRIAIRNADPLAGTVQMELVLINTTLAGSPSVSLGRQAVTSKHLPDESQPSREVLTFPIPSGASIEQFDELMVRFPRNFTRAYRSARIAIDRFQLIPHA